MIKNISNLGDAAVYCDFGVEVNKSVNSEVIKYFKALKKENVESINVCKLLRNSNSSLRYLHSWSFQTLNS